MLSRKTIELCLEMAKHGLIHWHFICPTPKSPQEKAIDNTYLTAIAELEAELKSLDEVEKVRKQ